MTESEMTEKLKSSLPEKRFIHSVGVMETSVKLAKRWNANEHVCRLAGLLHDCAKYMDRDEMLSAIKRNDIRLYPVEEKETALLHAPAGAAEAFEAYGVKDKEVLSAIRKHTIGAPQMSLEDKIVFTADMIEPSRSGIEDLERIRDLAFSDLDKAVSLCKSVSRRYCEKNGYTFFAFNQ